MTDDKFTQDWGFSREEAAELFRDDRAMATKSSERWALWLAVGNAAGLATFGAKVADKPESLTAYLLMPSCWLFILGLLAAAIYPRVEHMRFDRAVTGWHQILQNGAMPKPMPKILVVALGVLEVVAASAFAAGLIRPAAVLTLRYFATGSFAP